MRPLPLLVCVCAFGCGRKNAVPASPKEAEQRSANTPAGDASLPGRHGEPATAAAFKRDTDSQRDPFVAVENPSRANEASIPEDWVEHKTKYFSFRAPKSLVGGPGSGIDSYVGDYTMGSSLELCFDYGMFSNPLKKSPGRRDYRRRAAIVDGHDGYLVWCVDRRGRGRRLPYEVGLYIPPVKRGSDRLMFLALCADEGTRRLARMVLLSLRFHLPAQHARSIGRGQ